MDVQQERRFCEFFLQELREFEKQEHQWAQQQHQTFADLNQQLYALKIQSENHGKQLEAHEKKLEEQGERLEKQAKVLSELSKEIASEEEIYRAAFVALSDQVKDLEEKVQILFDQGGKLNNTMVVCKERLGYASTNGLSFDTSDKKSDGVIDKKINQTSAPFSLSAMIQDIRRRLEVVNQALEALIARLIHALDHDSEATEESSGASLGLG